ncbi:Protein of unknown function [Bacillus mycoides]|nr:Protein of unknown function [Bacillus mycoides]
MDFTVILKWIREKYKEQSLIIIGIDGTNVEIIK